MATAFWCYYIQWKHKTLALFNNICLHGTNTKLPRAVFQGNWKTTLTDEIWLTTVTSGRHLLQKQWEKKTKKEQKSTFQNERQPSK